MKQESQVWLEKEAEDQLCHLTCCSWTHFPVSQQQKSFKDAEVLNLAWIKSFTQTLYIDMKKYNAIWPFTVHLCLHLCLARKRVPIRLFGRSMKGLS